MSGARYLLKAGTLSGSMGVYVPAMVLHKALGLARVLLFAHFLRGAAGELELWYLGLMIFTVLAPLVCLGSGHALARYVSLHEARGQLRRLWRRAGLGVLGVCLAMGLAALAARGPITRWAITACQPPETPHAALGDAAPGNAAPGDGALANAAAQADFARQVSVGTAAIANAILLALYYNLLAFANGMRLYRLTSAIEVFFGILFAALGCAALAWRPDGLLLLLAHLASVGAALGAGGALLYAAVRRSPPAPSASSDAASSGSCLAASQRRALTSAPPPPEASGPPLVGEEALIAPLPSPADASRGGPTGFLLFALVALVGSELWVIAGQLSFYLASRSLPAADGAAFGLFRQLAEPVAFLAAAAWTVLYGHVARAWEGGDRPAALFRLQTAYKAVAVATMSVAVLVQAASPLWLRLLDPRWRLAAALLPGLLLFFQMVGNLGLANLAAWLVERPALAMLPPLAGTLANLVLAAWWMPAHGAAGAAWAAGAGMALGGGLTAVLCLSMGRLRVSVSVWLVLLAPAAVLPMALAASWAPAAAWAAFLAMALATPWVFDSRQKAFLLEAAGRAIAALRRRGEL